MLNNIKIGLFGEVVEDAALDAKLQWIVDGVTARLRLRLGGIEPPESMNHIIEEVAIVRYNRIGSEGIASHTVEGESMTFAASDFEAYAADIQAFMDAQKELKKGKVRFI
jgi:hypothetical protein